MASKTKCRDSLKQKILAQGYTNMKQSLPVQANIQKSLHIQKFSLFYSSTLAKTYKVSQVGVLAEDEVSPS